MAEKITYKDIEALRAFLYSPEEVPEPYWVWTPDTGWARFDG